MHTSFWSDRLVWVTAVIWVVYAYVTLTAPVGSNVLELSTTQLFWIRLSIALPYLAVWLAGVWGTSRLAQYAGQIFDSVDGKALLWITRGLFVLIAGLIIPTLMSLVRSTWPDIAALQAPIQIFNNYVYAFFPLVGLGLIWWGTQQLKHIEPKVASTSRHLLPGLILTGLLAGLLVIGVYTNPDRQVVVSPGVESPSYYISDAAIAITLILPSVASWVFGFLAATALGRFHRSVAAPVYRKGLNFLAIGLYLAIVGTILLNFLLSLGSARLVGLGLELLLGVIYLWLLALVLGYILVAVGARQLTAIEEVVVPDGDAV